MCVCRRGLDRHGHARAQIFFTTPFFFPSHHLLRSKSGLTFFFYFHFIFFFRRVLRNSGRVEKRFICAIPPFFLMSLKLDQSRDFCELYYQKITNVSMYENNIHPNPKKNFGSCRIFDMD